MAPGLIWYRYSGETAMPTMVNHCERPYTVARSRSPGASLCACAKASLTSTSPVANGASMRPARRYSLFCSGWPESGSDCTSASTGSP